MPSSDKKSPQITIQDVEVNDLQHAGEVRPGDLPNSTILESHNIVTVPLPKTQKIVEFYPDSLKDTKGIRYSDVKKTFPTWEEAKNARFRISALTRGPLSVAAEEEERIENEARRRVEERFNMVRDQVHKEGYEEGLALGKKDGFAKVAEQSKPMLETMKKLLESFDHAKEDIVKANEEFVVRMIYRIAKAVILREIKEDKDYTKRLVLEILERLGTSDNIKVFISPGEESSAQQLKEDLAKNLGQFKNITVEMDTKIQTAGCRVETDFSEVDARLEVQIENIAKSLVAKTS